MPSALDRLGSTETSLAASAVSLSASSAASSFDPTAGARAAPKRGVTPNLGGGGGGGGGGGVVKAATPQVGNPFGDAEEDSDEERENKRDEDREDTAGAVSNLAKMSPEEVFKEFDTDGSGFISFDEFRAMMPRLGIKMSVPKMLKYFRMCDSDGSGEIDVQEFKVALFACDPDSGNPIGFSPNALLTPLDAFEMFDEDGTGQIDEDEFFFVLEYLGLKVSDEKQEELFSTYDADGSGFIDYEEFKQVWLRVGNTRKELMDRGVAIPKFATKAQLMSMLEVILDEEEEKEAMALAEAARWRKWQAIIASKNKFIAKARRRADVELRSALDAAGQVYVFGGGTFDQFNGFVRKDMSTKSYQQDGFDKMLRLWFRRVRPGQEFSDRGGKGDDFEAGLDKKDAIDMSSTGAGVAALEDPRVEAATSAFHGINAAVNTCALWGRRVKEVAVSENVIMALTDLGEIFAWGGNDHWWHEVEPDSYWQTHWRGDTTARSKMLLMVQDKQEPDEEKPSKQDSPEDIEADKLKLVVQYYGQWVPPPGAEDRLKWIKGDLLPKVSYEEVQLSLVVRGKLAEGMTKNEMVDLLHRDFVLEKKVLGERAHRKISELEVEIVDLTKRRKQAMANKVKYEVNDMWRPLKEIQAEEMAKEAAKLTLERQVKYTKLEEGYEKWFQHIVKARESGIPEFTPRGNSYKFAISGITERAADVRTPRGYASCVSIVAGANHAGVIHQNGQLYTWGMGVSGRLGHDDTEGGNPRADVERPTLVQALQGKPVIRASCGSSHSAAIVSGGELYIWGGASSGKLGLGKLTTSQECYCSVPTRLFIPRCKKVRRVSCGANHTACVGAGGELFVWGCGDGGRLGLGKNNMMTQYSPVLVEALLHEVMGDVACGYFQTLALTAVKDEITGKGEGKLVAISGGKLYVAGPLNVLGMFCPDFREYPSLEGTILRHAAAGFGHQIAVSSEGELMTWGSNKNGCCGQHVDKLFIDTPMPVKCLYEAPSNVARGKPARQSSVYGGFDAHIAVTGPSNGSMTEGDCMHTQQDAQAWLEVDLKEFAVLSTIKLWNRTDEPTDMSMPRDKFSSRLFPCWIMISAEPFPDGVGGDNLRKCLDMCVARIRLVDDKRTSVWQVPDNITGRYVRVQLEGFNFLHFSQLEVFGVFGINKSVGRVSFAVAGKNVTVAVIRPTTDPRDTEIAYKRAVAADSYNSDILRQFETYALEYGKFGRGDSKNKLVTCLLCKGGQMCETCKMKFEHRDQLAKLPLGPGGRLRRLDSIADFLLDCEKPPIEYKPKPKKIKQGFFSSIGSGIKSVFKKKSGDEDEKKDGEGEGKKKEKKSFMAGLKEMKANLLKKTKKKGDEDDEEEEEDEEGEEEDGEGGGKKKGKKKNDDGEEEEEGDGDDTKKEDDDDGGGGDADDDEEEENGK